MKKNLRIVSAAAAALLAVAPVAATAVATPATTFAAVTGDIVAGKSYKLNNSIRTVNPTTDHNQGTIAANTTVKVTGVTRDGRHALLSDGSVVRVSDLKANADVVNTTTEQAPLGSQTATVNNTNGVFYDYGTFAASSTKLPGGSITISTKVFRKNGEAYYAVIGANGKATGQFVKAADVKVAAPSDNASESINAGNDSTDIYDVNANTNVNISAVAASNGIPSAINGNITYTDANGKSYTALLHSTGTNPNVTVSTDRAGQHTVNASELSAGKRYWANFNDVTINLGNDMANKKVTFYLPANSAWFVNGNKLTQKLETTTDRNGVADLHTVRAAFYAYDPTNMQEVHFYNTTTGNVVTSASETMHARNDGKLSVQALFATLSQKYAASQLVRGQHSIDNIDVLAPQNDLRDQLKKQNIDVDANGYFKAPASFTINLNAKSKMNGATASLPVTINVDNAAQTPAANETTKNITIMHIAAIYDKNGKATNEPALRAYDNYSVVSEPVTINGAKFYKLAGKDQYIKVGNVDGTKRSLKKNSYVYKSNGKAYTKKVGKKTKKTLKRAGSEVTTYGKSFMIAGSQMYRVGHNQYIKKANF